MVVKDHREQALRHSLGKAHTLPALPMDTVSKYKRSTLIYVDFRWNKDHLPVKPLGGTYGHFLGTTSMSEQ